MTTSAIILLFVGLMIAMFMFSLNQTVLANALPTIVGELDGVDQMLWVSTAFMLASTIMMPVYGKIGDLFGRKPLFMFAICCFLLGSVFALVLLSQLKAESSAWETIGCLALLGLGLSMQILVLVVQNAFPVSMVGTATASNNYFRQVGATLGMAFIGSVFTQRLMNNIKDGVADIMKSAPQTPMPKISSTGLTPGIVADLPEPLHSLIVTSYNDALVPLFLWVAPLAVLGFVFLCFLPNTPLAQTLKNEPAKRENLDVGETSGARREALLVAGEPSSVSLAETPLPEETRNDGTDDTQRTRDRRPRPAH